MSTEDNNIGVILMAVGIIILIGIAIFVLVGVFCLGGAYGGIVSIGNYIKSIRESVSLERPTLEENLG